MLSTGAEGVVLDHSFQSGLICCMLQWSCTVTQSCQSWHGFCSALRTATWLTATLPSSRSGRSRDLLATRRGFITTSTQTICLDVYELSISSKRSANVICPVADFKARTSIAQNVF